jgi:hypothetical protein
MGCEARDFPEEADPSDLNELAADGVTVYQAESATTKSGCSVSTTRAGYTGSGYINFGENGTWIEWNNINVASAGDYSLSFNYAVSTGSRQCAILVNGANVGNIPFSATGSWTTWKTVSISKALKAGNNTIRLLANTSSGGPNLDRMELAAPTTNVPLPYNMSNNFTCSQNTCTWTSAPIDIAGVSDLLISADARGDQYGQFESTDSLQMSYRIDSGNWVTFLNHTDDLAPKTITQSLSSSGRLLQIMLKATTSATNEIYTVSRLTVTKGNAGGDWKCNKAFLGTNDGCDCRCGSADPDCNGRGCTGPDCSNSACDRYHAACPEGQKCFLVPDAFGGKWKDVEKDPNTSHDNLFCWVAGPSNILDWSGWGQAGGLRTTDDIFKYAQSYWPTDDDVGPYDSGDDAYDFLKWFFVGDRPDEDFPPGGGFYKSMNDFYSYCNTDVSDPYVGVCPGEMASNRKAIMNILNAGFAGALQLKGDVGGNDGGHVITIWGYSVDKNNPEVMTGVFLTDSDDDKTLTAPPDRLFYRKAVYSNGVWHLLEKDGSPYKYIKYVYGLKRK